MSRALYVSIGLVIITVGVVGCAPEPEPIGPVMPPPLTPTAQAPSRVNILAYINVSSGCQEPTIEVLEELDEEYGDQVSLEFVDFGDEGEGTQRWKQDGLDCMAIQVNGGLIQVWEGENGEQQIVDFRNPVGYYWTHDDLKSMVAAWVAGKAHVASEEEAQSVCPPREIVIEVDAIEVTKGDLEIGNLMIGDRVAVKFRAPLGDDSPYERASQAADMLLAWIEGPSKKPAFKRKQVEEGKWAVMLGDQTLATVTKADAELEDTTPEKLAKKWLVGVRCAMAIAVRPD